ncbi:MAG: metallophosphoesterase [Helicobacteraceae bacterium]|jgi:bis(5'-nucleosyl)-tetraphosphatase (symmetrical)|nr:metallophosphoesterase [Helicobacteraceae bacterium]
MSRIIIYGDIHGCLDEWLTLRAKVKADANDREFCVGDLLNKGPKPLETLRYAQENGVKSVLGNHEEKYLEIAAAAKIGDTIGLERHLATFKKFSPADLDFLFAMPRSIKVANLAIVHAGLTNSVDLANLASEQSQILTRLRYISLGDDYRFWAELYNGNQGFVVYGHTPGDVRRDKHAIGIDTGCVYGYSLTAAIFNWHGKILDVLNVETKSVRAAKEYSK